MTHPAGKPEWRLRYLSARRARPGTERAAAQAAVAEHLFPLLDRPGTTVCAFVPLPSEPLDPGLPRRLADRGVRVLLPLARPGEALDWAEPWAAGPEPGDAAFARSRIGVWEPTGPTLGAGAIARTDVVLVPALAVDSAGFRLGRGGGYYDRSLPLAPRAVSIAVVFDDEVVPWVPHEEHDCAVTHIVTPRLGILPVRRAD